MVHAEVQPDLTQRAEDHGGPSPDEEAMLAEQGYPKLGQKIQSRVTQVEHGPYAGGTQQGDADLKEASGELPSGAPSTNERTNREQP